MNTYKHLIIAFVALAVAIGCTISVNAAKKKAPADQVVMTIAGEPVMLSEFEYLYKKNNVQQSMPLDQYVGMFADFKLKVRAARDARLDTLSSYKADMQRYTNELAKPYMIDKEMIDSFVAAAYAHRQQVVEVQHLMIQLSTQSASPEAQRHLADSIRTMIVQGADMGQLIAKHSADPSAKFNGGLMKFSGGMLPYEFEDAAFCTPVGQVAPIVETRFGFHIIKVLDRHANPGQVLASHILFATAGLDHNQSALKKHKADSVYQLLKNGANFAEMASLYTDDPSGKTNGGQLPWFEEGRMILPFERAAFAMANGEISEPVATQFGYHIILRHDFRPVPSIDQLRQDINAAIERDYRTQLAQQRAINRYSQECGTSINREFETKVADVIGKYGSLTPQAVNTLASLPDVVATVGSTTVTASDIARRIVAAPKHASVGECMARYNTALKSAIANAATNELIATLPQRQPDYRNLLNEYSDGMLLFEISNRQVWDKSNTDKDGLQAYFLAHKDKYTWTAPHYRGYLVSATTDSIAQSAVDFLSSLDCADSQYVSELRKRFGNEVKIDRVNAGRGENAIVDYIAFQGEKPTQTRGRFTAYSQFAGRIDDQPVDASDVKGAVGVDYQQHLEQQWLEQLRAAYPVKVNKKVLKQLEN